MISTAKICFVSLLDAHRIDYAIRKTFNFHKNTNCIEECEKITWQFSDSWTILDILYMQNVKSRNKRNGKQK